jgi:sugar transferase (PEP-CTERM/EpsH1 system associated)
VKILYITPRIPYPPIKGDQVVPYYRIRILSQRHEITLLSFYEKDDELAAIENLGKFCNSIYPIKLPKWKSLMNIFIGAPFSNIPFQLLYYRSTKFRNTLNNLLKENSFDLIHAYMLRVAPYLVGNISPPPKVLDLIDSMQLNLKRRIGSEQYPARWLYQEEFRRMVPYESEIGKFFDHMIVVSNNDREFLPYKNISVISLGVDSEYFSPQNNLRRGSTIVFSGNMGYGPNIQAVKWFVEQCFEDIKKEIPDLTFIIAGGNPTREVRSLSQYEGVVVTGFVESMPEILNQSTLAIAPMQSGSGMQNKILEAMSCGLPVITTSLGLGSINARQGQEIFVADTATEFTKMALLLLRSPSLVEEVGRRARIFVKQSHNWDIIVNQVESIYIQLLESRNNNIH